MSRADAGRAAPVTGGASRVRVGGVILDRPPEPYRPAPRGEDWRRVSLEVRVLAGGNGCECCGRRVGAASRLEAMHLVGEVELHALGPGVRGRFLCDARGLAAACRACHGLFDLFTQRTRDVRWIGPHRLARLLQWRQRREVADGLRRLAVRRAGWLATIVTEVDGDGGAGGVVAGAERRERGEVSGDGAGAS